MNKTKTFKGFTLIELLVAMGIMAVLTGMAIFNFNQSRVRARDVQRKNDIKQLQSALELYKNDNNQYPEAVNYQTLLIDGSYIKSEFKDPRSSEWVDYQFVHDPAGDLKNYYLQTCLENTADSSKTTNTTLCNKFAVTQCKCGTILKGVMYIVTQP